MNYKELKDKLNQLTPEQLQMDVLFWGENVSGEITNLLILEDDYINPSGEGCEPLAGYKNSDEYEFSELENEIIYKKGSVILNSEKE